MDAATRPYPMTIPGVPMEAPLALQTRNLVGTVLPILKTLVPSALIGCRTWCPASPRQSPVLYRTLMYTVALAETCKSVQSRCVGVVKLVHDLATEKDRLEKELVSVRKERDVASDQIAALTSRSALQRRLKEGYITMIPITERNIVRLSAGEDDAIRPVANQHAGQ